MLITTRRRQREPDDSVETSPESRTRSLIVGRLLLAYAIAASLVPLYPTMPVLGLDASWKVAINRAAAEGLQFGRDVVFTYGPYGGVLSGVYEPGIRTLVLAASLVLAAGFVAAALLALRDRSTLIHLLAALVVTVLTSLPSQGLDPMSLVYPFLVVAAVPQLPDGGRLRTLLVLIMALPLGLLPIMKLSVVPAVAAAVLAAGFLLARRRAWGEVAVLVMAPAASLVLWWVAAHQSVSALPDYARSSWYLVAGYSQAMSVHEVSRLPSGAGTEIFVMTTVLLLAVAALTARSVETLVVTGMTAVTLFLVFKSGFVRADAHMQSGALPLLAAAVVLLGARSVLSSLRLVVGLSVACGATLCWLSAPVTNPVTDVVHRTTGLAGHVLGGDAWSSSLRHRYADAMASIRHQASLPSASGPADLYTSTLNLLFAQGARWDPRPVIQSYAAYTPELARMNARHLTGPDAPRTIFFQIGPIDGRLPSLEDGASWVPLLQHYDVRPESSGYLVLRRRASPRPVAVGEVTQVVKGHLGSRIQLPDPGPGTAWLANLDLRPTFAGRLRNLLWKQPQLQIEVHTADGAKAVHRLIPAMARSDFVLSPYVADTDAFRSLFPGQSVTPAGRTVTSIRVLTDSSSARHFWAENFSIRLRSVRVSP